MKLPLLGLSALVFLGGCVSTPQGTKFNPWEGAKRIDHGIDAFLDRQSGVEKRATFVD